MSEFKDRGNSLFAARDYRAAAAAYTEGLTYVGPRGDPHTRSVLLSNRAACALALGDMPAATADCKAGLELDPRSAKLHYRLARALAQQEDFAAASVAIASAVGLLQSEPSVVPSADMLQLFREVAAATSAESYQGLQLPHDANRIGYVSSVSELSAAASRGAEVTVLGPGTYTLSMPLSEGRRNRLAILGVGKVQLQSQHSHAVFVQRGTVSLVNLQLAGDGMAAAVCVSPPEQLFPGLHDGSDPSSAQLQMIDCQVEQYPGGAVLVHGGNAYIKSCSFKHCGLMAVEVRQGGSMSMHDSKIEACSQGVCAYGGAKRVEVVNCSIQQTLKEGILAAGAYENAATLAQRSFGTSDRLAPFRDATTAAATQQAEEWGRKQQQELVLAVSGCTVAKCGNFGLSIDSGASATISGCTLQSNDPYSVYVKGSSDGIIIGCQILYGGKSGKSLWAKQGGKAIQMQGVRIGANYAGDVRVLSNAFAGREEDAVHSEFNKTGDAIQYAALGGLWSKPPVVSDNTFHSKPEQMPSIAALTAKLPGAATKGYKKHRAPKPQLSSLCRPSATFPQASWSPTGHQYYVIGNTHGFNVAAGLPESVDRARILLAGCGDVRNLLATVAGCMKGSSSSSSSSSSADGSRDQINGPAADGSSSSSSQLCQVTFVMNDGSVSMLARNAVMLYMIAELRATAEDVLAVWANHAITQQQSDLLLASCKALAEEPWPTWLTASETLNSLNTEQQQQQAAAPCDDSSVLASATATSEQQIRSACAAWATCTCTLQQLLQWRDDRSAAGTRTAATELSLAAVSGSSSPQLKKVITQYIKTGTLQLPISQPGATSEQQRQQLRRERVDRPNPTFLLAPELQYTAYFSSSVFRAVPMAPAAAAAAGVSAVDRLLATVAPQIRATAEGLRQGTVHVVLVPGDILCVATAAPAAAAAAEGNSSAGGTAGGFFDFIDTSNVSDYTSLPALLQACAALLLPAPHARLRLESMRAYKRLQQHQDNHSDSSNCDSRSSPSSIESFVQKCLGGSSLSTYQTMLRIRLLSGQVLPGLDAAVRLDWAPALSPVVASQQLKPALDGLQLTDSSRKTTTAAAHAAAASKPWHQQDGQVITAVSLFLELKPAFKHFVESYINPAIISKSGLYWYAVGSPLTLVHMLALAAPHAAASLVMALLRTASGGLSGSANLFKWEMSMHASLAAGRMKGFSTVTYPANPGYRLMGYTENPLLLAFSPVALGYRTVDLKKGEVKQLFSSFVWDEDLGVATVLLPSSVSETSPSWARYVTLCVVGSSGLLAVGESKQFGCLKSEVASGIRPWKQMSTPRVLNCQLLDQVGQLADSRTGWRSLIDSNSCSSNNEVVVDVLAPTAVHSDAAVKVTLADETLTVKFTPQGSNSSNKGKKKQRSTEVPQQQEGLDAELLEGEYTVKLPSLAEGVYAGRPNTKLSRALGLLSVRVHIDVEKH